MEGNSDKIVLSICIPSFNGGKFANRLFTSISRSRFIESIEVIVQDNCSSDETHDVCTNYKFVSLYVEPDNGQSDAVNRAVAKARGSWVIWQNIDDYFDVVGLDTCIEILMKEGDKFDVLYGDTWIHTTPKGKRLHRFVQVFGWNVRYIGLLANNQSTFVRSQVFKDYKLNVELNFAMDREWFYRLYFDGMRFRHVPITVSVFVIHDESKSGSNNRAQWDIELEWIYKTYGIYDNSIIRKAIRLFTLCIERLFI